MVDAAGGELPGQYLERRDPNSPAEERGPDTMLAAVKNAAGPEGLRQLSVEERMGCGNGSCNGCVVPVERGYVRSCVEGPVFRAEVLAW